MKFLLPLALTAAFFAGCSSNNPISEPPPSPPDASPDAPSCSPPTGYECCEGDVEGTYSCSADGGVVCSAGTHLTPSNQCVTPPPLDAGPDAKACSLPAGYDCCEGDVEGTYTCATDGGVVCSAGTHLTPSSQCITPPPADAGPDAPVDASHHD